MAQGPSNIEKHLKGVNYPASKNDLVQAAQRNNAPTDIMNNIRNLREERFTNQQEVMKAFGTGGQQQGQGQNMPGGQQGRQQGQQQGQNPNERMGGQQRRGME